MLTWDALLIDAGIPLPGLKTGRPIAQTENRGYPAYFESTPTA
jgi:hypothetical protein